MLNTKIQLLLILMSKRLQEKELFTYPVPRASAV
jgi:hypothetical protein